MATGDAKGPVPGKSLGRLLDLLEPFHPLIAGTWPLGIHVEGSDIDVLCEVPDLPHFRRFVSAHPEWFDGVPLHEAPEAEPPATVLALTLDDLPVEVFAQALPVHRQLAYRHMVVEGRVLAAGGRRFAERIRALKRQGLGTEPAFASLLGLQGDPYAALLGLEDASPEELARLVDASSRHEE